MEAPCRLQLSLNSQAGLETFPDNRSTSFINRLPRTILNQKRRKFKLRVDSIGVCNYQLPGDRLPDCGYIKIHVDEVERQRAGRGYTSAAAGFPFPLETPTSDRRYGYHTFPHGLYLPLRFQQLEKLHITLTDLHGKEVKLAPGFPTLLQATVMEESEEEEQFTISCSSLHPELFPENTLNAFTSPLPSEVDLSGHEVCLQQVVFPPRMRDEHRMAVLVVDHQHIFTFNLANFPTTRHFTRRVRDTIAHHLTVRHQVRFAVEPGGIMRDHAYLRTPADADPNNPLSIRCNRVFQDAMGLTGADLPDRYLPPGATLYFGMPNIHLALPSPIAMLQCDILESNIMSSKPSKLLQCIPLIRRPPAGDEVDMTYRLRLYEPPTLSFSPVKQQPFNCIRFSLVNPDGSSRKLLPATLGDSIFLTLAFRRRRGMRERQFPEFDFT